MFLISCFSTIIVLLMGIYILVKIKKKKQIHRVFLLTILCEFLWCISTVFDSIYLVFGGVFKSLLYLELFIVVFSVSYFPVMFLLMGIIFRKIVIKFNYKYCLLFVSPTINVLLFLTNKYHHLSFRNLDNYEWGIYFIFNMVYSYICIAIGFFDLIYFSIKNAGYFSNQAKLIIIGAIVPFIVNILCVISVLFSINLPQAFYTFQVMPVSLVFTIICYAFAIFKFDFLNVLPIALEKIVDHISDSYVVLNEDCEVIDFNRTFVRTFGTLIKAKRKNNFIEHLYSIQSINIVPEQIEQFVRVAIETKKSHMYEKHFVSTDGSFDKHFEMEFTPIMSKKIFIGILILFRDVTQHVENVEKIKQTQNQLMQKERLASLGELAGGVAHDINSPLSAMQNDIYIINALAKKAIDSGKIEDESILKSLNEMTNRAKNLTNATQKIVKIVNSVRNHTRNLSGETIQDFYIGSVIDDLKILLDHHLKKAKCELDINSQNVQITGDPGKLSQVMTNLIMNAVQAYSGDAGKIEVELSSKDEKALIKVRDYAGGIPEEFQNGIFKNILTTKGTEGTGLGLYLCYSIITGNFGGKIWFESKEGEGTTFFVEIPMKKAAIVHSN